MSQGIRRAHQAVDFEEAARRYPPPPEYFEGAYLASAEEIERVQLARLRHRADQAYRIPFHRRRWDAAGFAPGDLRTLEDLWRAPAYTVDDIRRSIEAAPPFGDYQAVVPGDAVREPMRLYMSGGTTGASRPTFYTAWDRAVGGILEARQLYMQGVRPGDVVVNSWSYGTHNGAFSFDEAAYQWLNCVVITASTGNVTSSRKQVELALEYGATAILTTGDYVLRLAEVVREMGLDPRKDLALKAIPNIGDTALLEETFGLPCFATYGFHEVQTVAVECEARDGLHVFEDAFVVQVVDAETGERLPDGETGALVVTELYKTGSAQFRYNIMDLSYLMPRHQCACGSWLRKIGPFAGRGDNMVKLRGVNLWPEVVGEVATAVPGTAPDYFVRAVREGNRDEMVVHVVAEGDPAGYADLADSVEGALRERFGVRIRAEIAAPGALDGWTGVDVSPKLKRFRDER